MSDAVEKKERGKRLTPRQRQEILNLWATGEITYDGLIKRYGKSKRAFQYMFEKAGVKHGERVHEVQKAVDDEFKKQISQDAEVIASRTRETKEECYKLQQVITKLVGKVVIEQNSSGKPMGDRMNDLKALSVAASALKTAREERYRCLGIGEGESSDKDAPEELMIQEMTVEDIMRVQQASKNDVDADFDSGKAIDIDESIEALDDELIRADQESEDDGSA